MTQAALRKLWTECFGDEGDWISCFFHTAYREDNTRILYRQDKIAAGLCWMDVSCGGKNFAYVFAVATAAEFRHQGLCRQLMDQTHEILRNRGYAGSILVPANPDLRNMYQKMGYVNFGGIQELSVTSGEPLSLRKVSPREYSALRRQFLPSNGVIQENGAVEFLHSSADLYAGADFLLAISNGFGIELLGNANAAPGILASLGLDKAVFRIPGQDPFAMFRSLSGVRPPEYFGLAFD